jgi:hypothetical protein
LKRKTEEVCKVILGKVWKFFQNPGKAGNAKNKKIKDNKLSEVYEGYEIKNDILYGQEIKKGMELF